MIRCWNCKGEYESEDGMVKPHAHPVAVEDGLCIGSMADSWADYIEYMDRVEWPARKETT